MREITRDGCTYAHHAGGYMGNRKITALCTTKGVIGSDILQPRVWENGAPQLLPVFHRVRESKFPGNQTVRLDLGRVWGPIGACFLRFLSAIIYWKMRQFLARSSCMLLQRTCYFPPVNLRYSESCSCFLHSTFHRRFALRSKAVALPGSVFVTLHLC